MSAEPISEPGTQSRPRLAVVHTPTATVSTLGFVAIIAVLIAAGLAGVMVVSTSVGQQSRDLTDLRRQATELGYTGALDGSAEMNIWLHKAVMRELAANGGKVPADLTD